MSKNKFYNILGYNGKEIYENKISGMKTIEVDIELYEKIKKFAYDIMNRPIEIRGFKDKGKKFSFKCGVGYDIIDVDLLEGYGDGLTKRIFEEYVRYIQDKKDYQLKNLESLIDEYNSRHKFDTLSKKFIEDEKAKQHIK